MGLSRCSEAETGPGSLHRLPKCAPAAVPASSRAAMPTGALHRVPAGLRGCAPEDPSEDKPDCAKEKPVEEEELLPCLPPLRGRPAVEATGLAQQATSLCSPELSAQTPM